MGMKMAMMRKMEMMMTTMKLGFPNEKFGALDDAVVVDHDERR